MKLNLHFLSILLTSMMALAYPTPKATASESLDADEAVVYSTKDANVWEKRQMAELDADEAVVYSSKDANVWE